MAVYAIGDLQGCYDPLQRLLERLQFEPTRDRLWLVGDLINRGPKSLAVLRFLYTLDSAVVSVLGNHDLTLLAIAEGYSRTRRKDTVDDILAAPDRAELLRWLRHRPLLHHDVKLGYTMVHAGLAPHWNLAQAQACACELEKVLRGSDYRGFLKQMFGSEPDLWDPELRGFERMRCIVNYLTRLRFCDGNGRMSFAYKGPPGSQPAPWRPWFELSWRRNADLNIVFGHWAALGFYRAPGIVALDSGCVWGNALTAFCLQGGGEIRAGDVISVPSGSA